MPFSLTMQDVFYAAALALVFTWLINMLSRVFRLMISHSTQFDYNPGSREAVTEKCNAMFPHENVRFNGETFKRGMSVKVVTSHNLTIEGRLVGMNNENMVCFITQQSVIAQELDKIEEMRPA
jgi:hypothetical protein